MINQKYILKNLKPNLTIILKSDSKTIFSRIKKRKKINKFDKLKVNFYNKAQKAYISRAKNNKKYRIFDSSKNNSDLEKELFKLVIKKLH
jgi:dTMP kinase